MVVNFRARKISRDKRKLAQTPILIIIIKKFTIEGGLFLIYKYFE